MRPSGIRPNLSPEDEGVKQKLVKCSPRTYSKLIRSDIEGPSSEKSSRPSKPSGAKSSRPYALRPSQSSFMKLSQEELQAQVEFLAKKKRSAKRKVPVAPKSSPTARGKVPKLGESYSPSSIREDRSSGQFRARGHTPHLVDEVSEVTGPQFCSPLVVIAKSSPERTVEPPLDIMPISIWSPSAQSAELPSGASKGEGRKLLRHERGEDSFLANAELAAGALSSILRDSDLKKADSMSVEEAPAFSLQGVVMVCPDAFTCPSYR